MDELRSPRREIYWQSLLTIHTSTVQYIMSSDWHVPAPVILYSMRYEGAVLGGVYNSLADLAAWLYRLNHREICFHIALNSSIIVCSSITLIIVCSSIATVITNITHSVLCRTVRHYFFA